ncbi:MAG: hypothetical protein H6R13_2950 [Proteobacteria bacterium]|nr:hypothetical protein [Pseudomonadota bacterium]
MNALSEIALRSLNHVIQGEDWAKERLCQHAGARISIEAGGLSIRLAIDDQGLFFGTDSTSAPDVTVTLPADALARAMFDRGKLFAAAKLGGSADVAESFAFVLRNLRWDVEADLAQLLGNIPARRLNLLGLSVVHGIQNSLRKVAENIKEYAVEDSTLLTSTLETTEFGNEVNRLRDDVARLEKRISRL